VRLGPPRKAGRAGMQRRWDRACPMQSGLYARWACRARGRPAGEPERPCGWRVLARATPFGVFFGKYWAFGQARVPGVRPLRRCRPFLWYFLLGVKRKYEERKAAKAVKVSMVIQVEYLIRPENSLLWIIPIRFPRTTVIRRIVNSCPVSNPLS